MILARENYRFECIIFSHVQKTTGRPYNIMLYWVIKFIYDIVSTHSTT